MLTVNGKKSSTMTRGKERLDKLLLERGLVETRSRGQAIIMAGEVLVDGEPVSKAGQLVPIDASLEIVAPAPYVSRGGFKLAAALDAFQIDVTGKVCADVGACTGGFTDVLIQNGADRVYAIDVGYGQLDWSLRRDERVIVMERTNARYLDTLPELVDIVTVDVSFISIKHIIPAIEGWLGEDGQIVSLIKPQFEAGRQLVGKGGLVKDPDTHRLVLSDLIEWIIHRELSPEGLIRSPITGASGNIEFLIWIRNKRDISRSPSLLLSDVGFT